MQMMGLLTKKLLFQLSRAEEPGDQPRDGHVRRGGEVRHLPQLGAQECPDLQGNTDEAFNICNQRDQRN